MSGATAAGPGRADSYYGRPILKEPAWTWEIPVYLFTGGLGGASSVLSLAARGLRRERLARVALHVGAVAEAVSPVLLISDLGRPDRALKMLRVLKPTSPMSVGSWLLAVSGSSSAAASALDLLGRLPRVRLAAELVSGLAGPPLATYTGVLVADTAIPVWHEGREELPIIFGASAGASAGAAATLLLPPGDAGPARRLAVLGVVAELALTERMRRRLGFLAEPYRRGPAGALLAAAEVLAGGGAAVLALRGRQRGAAAAGAAMVLAGEMCLRWSVFRAGFQSARDPRYTVEAQRGRA